MPIQSNGDSTSPMNTQEIKAAIGGAKEKINSETRGPIIKNDLIRHRSQMKNPVRPEVLM